MQQQPSHHRRFRLLSWLWPLAIIAVALLAVACGPTAPPVVQATPDYRVLETRVEAMLRATYTAMAPPATPTPEPTHTSTPTAEPPTPVPTVTPAPAPLHGDVLLAYVQQGPEGESNIVMDGAAPGDRVTLSRLAGSEAITDLSWAPDGQSLLFVSGYNSLLSRRNERNLFLVRSDGTGLRMITGAYLPANEAPGPYVTLEGRIVGAEGDCLVTAQGVAGPTLADPGGAFRVPGVPVGATWARAVCNFEGRSLAGDVIIAAADGIFPPAQIEVTEGGQGWKQADLSRNGLIVAGTYYRWGLPQEDDVAVAPGVAEDAPDAAAESEPEAPEAPAPKYRFWGRIRGLETGYEAELETVQEGDLDGVDWSPVDDVLVGALTGGDGGWIWLWDASGASVGELFKMPNPDDQILTLANPAWSPDGSYVVFEARRWYWWGENKYRTDLMLISGDGQTIMPLVQSAWGEHARNPGWMPDGQTVVYQYSRIAPEQGIVPDDKGSIWTVLLDGELRLPWTAGPADGEPAPHPWAGARPEPTGAPTLAAD